MVLEQLAAYSVYAVLPLRIVIGILYARHGYNKLFAKDGQKGTAGFFKSVGIPFSSFAAILVGILEFFGGIFLVAGFLTRIVAVLLALQMLVALYVVKFRLKKPFVGGWELDATLIASLIALALLGAGAWAVGY